MIMAYTPLFYLFLVQPTTALAQGWQNIPYYEPPHNFSCDNIDCGKGKCVMNSKNELSSNGSSYSCSYSYSYGCTCDEGWIQSSASDAIQHLPCVLPNCTFSNPCSQNFAFSTPQSPPKSSFGQFNTNACNWAICGEGTCVSTSSFTYQCDCKPGFSNLLSMPILPCYKECQSGPGPDCARLGITMPRSSNSLRERLPPEESPSPKGSLSGESPSSEGLSPEGSTISGETPSSKGLSPEGSPSPKGSSSGESPSPVPSSVQGSFSAEGPSSDSGKGASGLAWRLLGVCILLVAIVIH